MGNKNTRNPRVINSDKDGAITSAIKSMKKENDFYKNTVHKPIKYLNNIIEQDHRFIRKIIRPMLGFKTFKTASKTTIIVETMHMIYKAQVKSYFRDYKNEQDLLNQLFVIDNNEKALECKMSA